MKKIAGIIIRGEDGHILAVHAKKHKKNKWSIPKGKKDKGESMKKAAIRECREETGVCLSNYKKKVKKFKKKKMKNKIVFLYLFDCGKIFNAFPNGKEIDKVKWIKQKQLKGNPKNFLQLKQ